MLACFWMLLHWSNGVVTSILFWSCINAATSAELCFVHPSHAELMFWCSERKHLGFKNRPQDMFENEVMGKKKNLRARWEAQKRYNAIFFSNWTAVLHVKTQCFLTVPDFMIFWRCENSDFAWEWCKKTTFAKLPTSLRHQKFTDDALSRSLSHISLKHFQIETHAMQKCTSWMLKKSERDLKKAFSRPKKNKIGQC